MSSKVRFTILNKAGKVIRSTNRPLLNNNTVKYKKKIYKLLKAPTSMKAKYVIVIDSESSTSVDYKKKIKLMSLEEFKNISHTEKQKSTGWTKVTYPGGSMVTDIKYGAKKDVYETLKLKGILPKTYKHKSKIHVKTEPQIIVYHGTDANFKDFKKQFLGSAHGTAPINLSGFSFTDKRKVAKTYGKNILKVRLQINKPFIIDAKGENYSTFKHKLNEILDRVDRKKYDVIIIKNYEDAGIHGEPTISNHYIPFNENQIFIINEKQKIIITENKECLKINKAKIPESITKDIEFFKPKYSKLPESSIFHIKHKNKHIQYFMYHPKRRELLVSSESSEIKSHADLHALHSSVKTNISKEKYGIRGYKSDYDDFIKGWYGVSNNFKNGIIHFHYNATGWEKNPELFNDIMNTLEVFKLNGSNENTEIKGLGTKMETMKQYS